ncbi:hypothetical protein O3M35_012628 [Rhynocoris fuscipes]|uniref:N-acetylglucosamine-6-phosphate deacetylase n=1 Tax=Rhynocoris fuscipes TaxID=488301 RepID=A0AAW1CZH4_9HEMI
MWEVDSSKKIFRFTECSILRDHKIYKDDIWFCDGKIIDPQEICSNNNNPVFYEAISLKDMIVSPGFIDLQTNGGFGIDFTHDLITNPELLDTYSEGVLAHGVTSFCPTLVTAKPDVYHSLLSIMKKRVGGSHGAEVLGLHLEGPFINRLKKGGHAEEDILDLHYGIDTLIDVYGDDFSNVMIITLAPELDADFSVINWLTREKGIVVSFHHRDPGLIGLLGTKFTNPLYFTVITDGVHIHPAALKVAYNAHPDGVIIITDAISVMGLPDGIHNVGGKQIEIKGKSAFIADTNTLCGSVNTMNESVKYFIHAVGCTVAQALEAATLHPAQVLGITNKKGTLDFGSDADFVILDHHLNVISTWIAGKLVYQNPEHKQEPSQPILTSISDSSPV